MSGRSGYRKTDRRNGPPRQRFDYVLRFKLPETIAFALSPGQHGFGVTVGYLDFVFVHGRNGRHCCDLAAAFLYRVNADRMPMLIPATVVKLPVCEVHTATQRKAAFEPLTADVEAIHDRVDREAVHRRDCVIAIGKAIIFRNAVAGELVYELEADHRNDPVGAS